MFVAAQVGRERAHDGQPLARTDAAGAEVPRRCPAICDHDRDEEQDQQLEGTEEHRDPPEPMTG